MIDIREIENREDFNSFIETNKDDLHLIKFGTEYCGPCKLMENRLKNLDSEKIGKTLLAEITICDDETEALANEFMINGVPVLAYIKDGEMKYKSVGVVSSDDVYKKINELS